MAEGEFTKKEAQETMNAFTDILKALSKKNQIEFFGHANSIMFFLERAYRAAPDKEAK